MMNCILKKLAGRLVGLLLFMSLLLNNQGYTQEKVLTLANAVEMAQKRNLALQQGANQVQSAGISIKQKKSNLLPELNLSARSAQTYDRSMDPGKESYESSHRFSFSGGLSASYNIFNGFYDTSSLRQAEFEYQAEAATFVRTEQEVIFETVNRFLQYIIACEFEKLEVKNLEVQSLLLKRIEDFYKAGKRPVTDYYLQEAEIARAKQRLLSAQRNVRVNKILLFQTLGIDDSSEYGIDTPGVDVLVSRVPALEKETALNDIIKKRADIQAYRLQVEAAKQGIEVAKSGLWPKLSLSADLTSNYSSSNDSYNVSQQLFTNNPSFSVALSLSFPVFDKNRTKTNIAVARLQLKSETLGLERLTLQTTTEMKTALEDFRIAGEQVVVADTQLQYTGQALASMEERYNLDAATLVELNQVRNQHLEALYNQVEARTNLFLQRMTVAFHEGDGGLMMSMIKD